MKPNCCSSLCVLILVGFLWGSTNESPAELIITPVAVPGQPAPGLADGVTFSGNFGDVQINDSGEVLFIANVTGPGVTVTNRTGLWTGLPGEMVLVAREGSQAPGYAPGVSFSFLGYPLLPPNGLPAFFARLQGPGISEDAFEPGNDDTVWAVIPRGAAMASAASPANLDPALRLAVLFFLCLRVKAFTALVSQAGPNTASGLELVLWIGGNCLFLSQPSKEASLQQLPPVEPFGFAILRAGEPPIAVAFPGDPAPGTQETFVDIDRRSLVASGRGQLSFAATTSGGKQGIWSGTATNLQPVAFSGDPLPPSLAAEFGPVAKWSSISGFSGLGMNAKGEVAFGASILRAPEFLGFFLFAGPPDAPRVAARFVPPASPDEGFLSAGNIVMNAAGDVAFIGPHTSLRDIPIPGAVVNGLGLTHQHGPPKLMLAEGKTAPGLNDGEVISFFGFGGGPFMNRHGQVLIHAEIGKAVGFEHRTDQGLWLVDPVRGPQLVARGGTQIDLGGGRMGTIAPTSVSFFTTHDDFHGGGADGRPKPFNDLGQVVFVASGSGVFVAGEVRVLSGRKVGEDIEVAFATALGRKYRVEFREAVESGAWATLKEGVDGTGGSVIVTDVGAAKLPKRFYRAVALPQAP